jgi:chorismate mutase
MSLDQLRKQIDSIDEKIVRLLGERAACALRIGEEKRRRSVPVLDPGRESQVLARVGNLDGSPLDSQQVQNIYETIMAECSRVQEPGAERNKP